MTTKGTQVPNKLNLKLISTPIGTLSSSVRRSKKISSDHNWQSMTTELLRTSRSTMPIVSLAGKASQCSTPISVYWPIWQIHLVTLEYRQVHRSSSQRYQSLTTKYHPQVEVLAKLDTVKIEMESLVRWDPQRTNLWVWIKVIMRKVLGTQTLPMEEIPKMDLSLICHHLRI